MANTLIPIKTYTLTSNTASVTFSGIPQNYTDLKIVVSARTNRADTDDIVLIQPNGTSSNLSYRSLTANGSSVSNGTANRFYVPADSFTSSIFSNTEITIPNYSGSATKSWSIESAAENNGSTAYIGLNSVQWSDTTAITSLVFSPVYGTNFISGSTFTLYGISSGIKATGGTVTVAGGYAYHTFTSSGLFSTNQRIKNAEVLCVAGGGGGSRGLAGGGGAGGVTYSSAAVLNAGARYLATVGSGGAGSTNSAVNGVNGGNSQFASATIAIGGGGGGATDGGDGNNGGSGGGAGWLGGSGGTATSGQGYAGANGYYNGFSGSGGGGAGGVGVVAGTNSRAGDGGPGTSTYSTWHAITGTGVLSSNLYYIAGGGGGGGNNSGVGSVNRDGGYGGVGGGGTGGRPSEPTAGTANTGGGGAGGQGNSTNSSGAAGGSGLIIVRYPLS